MSSMTTTQGATDTLKSVLKKPSKMLTVGLEYFDKGALSAMELNTLSMQLRKCKASALWCSSLSAVEEFAKEQESARGNFPGPCPVIYNGVEQDAALAAGASAIVCTAEDTVNTDGCEVIWKVSNAEELQAVLERTGNIANVFLLDKIVDIDQVQGIVASLPEGSIWIASLDPMHPDGAEVNQGKELKKLGCSSVVVKKACVGDSEDLEYAQFLFSGLTSKASSEFKFSGLTGSTNGHFGGVQASGTVKWRRPTQS